MPRTPIRTVVSTLLLGAAAPAAAIAQAGAPPADTTAAPAKPAAPAPSGPGLSGVIHANYQTGGALGDRGANRFDVERAYLTVRAPAGPRLGVRATADVYQQADPSRNAYYRGWTMRMKYAYLQYDFLSGKSAPLGLQANARLGLLHTVLIDHEEAFWPRWIAQVATERAGYFSSSDAGAAVTVTLPGRLGELYTTVTNGPGYTSRENDRFKDYSARLTLTPLAGRSGAGLLESLTLSPWYYKGTRASDFAEARGTVLPVSEGRRKDRYGVFVGIRDPRLVIGAEVARRAEVAERADTLGATVPTQTDLTGQLLSAFTVIRPFALVDGASKVPLGVVLRWDEYRDDTDHGASTRFLIGGVTWDLGPRASLSFDVQRQTPREGATSADLRTCYLHAVVNF